MKSDNRLSFVDSPHCRRYHDPLTLQCSFPVAQDAGVAQLVEQLFRKQQVACSIQVAGSIHSITLQSQTLGQTWQVLTRCEFGGVNFAGCTDKIALINGVIAFPHPLGLVPDNLHSG